MRNVAMTVIVFLASLGLSGCSVMQVQHEPSTMPHGTAVSQAVEAQKLNPMPAGTEPVKGADGEYALKVLEQYQEGPKSGSSEGESLFQEVLGEMLN
ncbi:hypothetical protein [Desulfovibrio oxyclinae]|uniref:hypothetical protein n=1 Tax=Desulfovibrio oxyclinae TaxID=63560 RepID=UPI000381FFEA|nr:hypothetical protein [Desulfovibrio oxyclinae]